MTEPVLLTEKNEGITTLTLNRPQAMNALSLELRKALTQAFTDLQADPETRVVILTGAGKAFCAGVDLKELSSSGTGAMEGEHSPMGVKMISALEAFDRPIIAAVNGPAITGGFELALACDMRIASTNARFADTHARVGVVSAWGLSQKLQRLIGEGRAKELSLTGNFISAEQAAAWGLANRVVEPEELMPTCISLARDIMSCVPQTVVEYKRLINQGGLTTLAEGLKIERLACKEEARRFSAEAVAARRQRIIERGREQKGD
jgi:enoyl-CoA hydratase